MGFGESRGILHLMQRCMWRAELWKNWIAVIVTCRHQRQATRACKDKHEEDKICLVCLAQLGRPCDMKTRRGDGSMHHLGPASEPRQPMSQIFYSPGASKTQHQQKKHLCILPGTCFKCLEVNFLLLLDAHIVRLVQGNFQPECIVSIDGLPVDSSSGAVCGLMAELQKSQPVKLCLHPW